jgi:hypothetical protein
MYQAVKIYLQEPRPRVASQLGTAPDELAGLHRRFEVVSGAQVQVAAALSVPHLILPTGASTGTHVTVAAATGLTVLAAG